MIRSIRKYLLVYLGFAIGFLSVFLIIISNFYLDQKDIQQHLDSIMTISALTLESTIENLDAKGIKDTQSRFNEVNKILNCHCKHIKLPHFSSENYIKNFNFQILNANGQRMVYSPDGPILPASIIKSPGFHNIKLNHIRWRFFVSKHPKLNIYIILGEKLSYRETLVNQITRDDLLILLLIFPVSAILIWFIVSKSLIPLKQITQELKTRNPFHLTPMAIKNAPEEIEPMIVEMNQLLARLKEGLSREQAFAADAAHELRTPLATIKTLAQTAIENNDIEKIKMVLEKISYNVDRGSHVVQQLMNMSKTMPEALFLSKMEHIHLDVLVRETLSHLTPDALLKHIDIEMDVADKLPTIRGNKIALEILIRNLIDNSIRYTYQNTTIFVNIYPIENNIVLEVRDQGPGIPKDKQEKVFDRFYRAHDPKYQGSGLGLAIVKQIATLHHAQITLETPRTEKGIIIRVFFPIQI